MATKIEIQKAVTRLMKAFTAFRPDPEDMKGFMELVYEKFLQFPGYIVDRAVERIIETGEYFPRISEMLSNCYQERDKEANELWSRWQNLKGDWYGHKLHSLETWQKLAADYKKLGSHLSATAVMDDYKKYCKPYKPISAEKIAEAKRILAKLAGE